MRTTPYNILSSVKYNLKCFTSQCNVFLVRFKGKVIPYPYASYGISIVVVCFYINILFIINIENNKRKKIKLK